MPNVVADIIAHLEALQENCNSISPKTTYGKFDWIISFLEEPSQINELRLKESSIDLTEDSSMKDSFKKKSLINFWIWSKTEFPMLFRQALQFIFDAIIL